nr:hypothetical protein [Pseudalkalibacillus decolorationis]
MNKPFIRESKQNNIEISTNDKDLVELSGYHAYLPYEEEDIFFANEKRYTVVDTNFNHSSGLDALTVQNYDTGKYTIVFVGSADDTDWTKTNPKLLSDLENDQMNAARDYFDEMDEKYNISSICGNSLGGATTNAVAILHPEVKAVTINPALLPDGLMDPNKEYLNITNYFSKYDPLTLDETALKLDQRIPGKQYSINNGLPLMDLLASNHKGYYESEEGKPFYEIGVKGQPGYGRIFLDADNHVVTSIWTGIPLYGGNTERIKINKENLDQLVDALDNNVLDRLTRAQYYMGNSVAIVKNESQNFSMRVTKLQNVFEDLFENLVGNVMFTGITSTGSR